MTALIGVRAPYPELRNHIRHFSGPIFLYFMDTTKISNDFHGFHKKMRTAWEFLLEIRDIRGGKMRIDFGHDFKEALINAMVEENADLLVLPVEEAGFDFPFEVKYL